MLEIKTDVLEMNSPVFIQWQQWESRVEKWLNQSDDDLDLLNTTSSDRIILTILTVKYQVVYRNLYQESTSHTTKKSDERIFNVRLSKNRQVHAEKKRERDQDKLILFNQITSRLLSSEHMSAETSSEWKEFNQLCDWHGIIFMQRFRNCLHQFISKLISMTSAYQEFIEKPIMVSPVSEIINQVYETNKDDEIFLSIDIKSANFSMLQYINVIDVHMYPTWSDFLSVFVGSRPLLIHSKRFRMDCLGDLPERRKLDALWIYYMATMYQMVLCRCLTEKNIDIRCEALTGDEVVFHLDKTIDREKLLDLVKYIEVCLNKESPIVKFVVQAYRIRVFHWKDEHLCFARIFIDESKDKKTNDVFTIKLTHM
ncbi:hypothetical protein I4U23_003832 [Adineta vaga]|nr:hypothetical protein I4U23_003832 [Adineta vaga]